MIRARLLLTHSTQALPGEIKMPHLRTRKLAPSLSFSAGLMATTVLCGLTYTPSALADDDAFLRPGNLLVSRVVYDNNPANLTPGVTVLPPGCTSGCATATADGTYPGVFNNDAVDGSFGITSKIVLDQMTRSGHLISSLEVPNSSQPNIAMTSDQMVGSFSSKSEVALNLSTDKRVVTFMGYLASVDTLDVSNSNTPFVIDKTNPVHGAFYRVVVQVDARGKFHFTKSNAYSGNNGRAAILNAEGNEVYTAGNAGNGSKVQPDGVVVGTGAQILTPSKEPLNSQADPGQPTPVGSFNITELGITPTDKIGKDTNFRGLTIFNNVIYTTKGSGGNGVDTVYFVDTSGPADSNGNPHACPNGTGLPGPFATLPTTPLFSGNVPGKGVFPYNMCVLKGFNTVLANASTDSFPFGLWFADANTLYIADEGNGLAKSFSGGVFPDATGQTKAGLQKWVFDSTLDQWKLAYVLTTGLDLGVPYTVDNYPTGINAATGLPWSPATDGLRNLTGRLDGDEVTIWAVTSTVSGSGDQGADPNKLVMIKDKLKATSLPEHESFKTVRTARFAEVLRGVSFTPGTGLSHDDDDDGHDQH